MLGLSEEGRRGREREGRKEGRTINKRGREIKENEEEEEEKVTR